MRWGVSNYKIRNIKWMGNDIRVFHNSLNKRYELDDKIGFGKYYDWTIKKIIDDAPSYMRWMLALKPDGSQQFYIRFSQEAYERITRLVITSRRMHPFYVSDIEMLKQQDVDSKMQDAINEMKTILKENNQ